MAFVDELNIHIQAGRGGDGVVRWLNFKGKEFSGAAGGNGGRGGNVYLKGVRDIGRLAKYRHDTEFAAGDGAPGEGFSKYGKSGEELVLEIPIGSIVTNKETGREYHVLNDTDKIEILLGGGGGYGNEHFKGSRNVTPLQSTKGKRGEQGNFYVELKLIVDAGFIGFPNAGKSSLLNELTNAKAEVGSYQFTTLEPNLGALFGYILADIPGLIEGASDGKGLGHKFLRHITRTRLLVHCISLENEDVLEAYETIRNELVNFDKALAAKPEIIVLTKTDVTDEAAVKVAEKALEGKAAHLFTTSIVDDASIKQLSENLVKILEQHEA